MTDNSVLLILAVIIITFILLKMGQKKYQDMTDPLSKNDFGLKDFFPIGFFLMELARYRYGTQFDRKLLRKLRELYDPDYADYYLRVYWAAAASYLWIGLIAAVLLYASMGITGGLGGIALGAVLAFLSFKSIDTKIEERHNRILIDMPDFTNKILILSGAGMTLRAALIKIAEEMSIDTPLYQTLQQSVLMMKNGAADEKALEHLNIKCNTPHMRRFTSVVMQNMKRGGSDVIMALQDIGREQWAERKAAANRVSAEADTKLLFPMILMLGSVLVMTIVPAVLSMQI